MKTAIDGRTATLPGAPENGEDSQMVVSGGIAEYEVLPPSFSQERLWLVHQMDGGSTAYNIFRAFRLSGPLDVRRLERAFRGVIARHESLRTTFREQEGAPVQVIAPHANFALEEEDAPGADDAAREAWLDRRLADEAARGFDLEAGPLFRAGLLRLGETEHVLRMGIHHIVSDGWSMDVLYRELSALYADGGARLEPLPLQYADYALWQREELAGPALQTQRAYWRGRLAGAPALLELPADHARPAVQRYRGASVEVAVPGALTARLEKVARAEGATLYMVLMAAWQVLLARYSRATDIVMGTSVAGRPGKETEGLIGFFANTLALRTDLSGDPAFRQVLRQVRAVTLGAFEHQQLPFERLVEELQPERALAYNPIFQVFFALQNATQETPRLAGVSVEPVSVRVGTAKFDLSLLLGRADDGLRGVIEYNSDLFEPATAARAAAHLLRLLEGVAADPAARVSALPLLPDDERATLLGWSGAGERFAVGDTLHGRFAARAAARPAAVAVTCGDDTLTYGELDARAARLARRLRALGVGPESRVGLCAERSLEMVVGIIAILKAGGAYVPLDPAHPPDRLAYMAADAQVRVLLAPPALMDRVPGDGIHAVSLEDADDDGAADDVGVDVDPRSLAYVIYTSGSTGRPKGVGVAHANVLRLFDSTAGQFGFGESDAWTLFHSFAFDFSVWEIWGALLYGGRLVVVPWAVSRDPAAFRRLLARERVTVLNQTPSAFRALARTDEDEAEPLQALRYVIFGGEALQFESLRGWLDRYGPRRPRLVNMYGITETTVHVTWHTVTGAELRQGGAGSAVGTPIPDLRAYVLDEAGAPAPVGVPGELHVGGDGLARGYLGRPALTAQRFVPDPFSLDPGARLYRSGDLARWRADGTLEYRGRIDQQVKIRGFRIELGEIESLLLAHPGVAFAAVVVRGHGDDAALAAYVVPDGELPSTAELREALRRHLPEYMLPAAFVALDRIPLTANGKLDRAALPEPDAAAAGPETAYVAPRTPVEEVLAAIWAGVLGAPCVGALDNFFEIGGHSLLAARAVSRIREAFGAELPLRALFDAPTVAGLAERVEALRSAGTPAPPPVTRAERDAAPLSFAQERLWFLDRMEPGSAVYNVPLALRLAGALDVAALERALGEIVRRHAVLRTTFQERGGAPVQTVAPFSGFTLERDDLSYAGEDGVRPRLARESARPFDLAAGPVFRATLLRVGDEEHVLLLCTHHVATDGWSTGVLLRELAALYGAYLHGADSPLAEPPVQYADFAAWQREQLDGPVLEAQVAWWRARLAGAPALLQLPTDRPRPAAQSYRGGYAPLALPGELVERLRALARGEGATLYMVLLGAFQLLLSRYTGAEDVVVGSPFAGRTQREVEGLIGFFVNPLVMRTDLAGDPGFREVLGRVREVTLGAWEHQHAPFEKLVEALQPERSLNHSPLFQAVFTLQDGDDVPPALPGLRTEAMEPELGTSKFDLTLLLAQDGPGLRGGLGYSADLFDAATVQRMAGHLRHLLEQVAGSPDARLSAIETATEEERRTVLETWGGAEAAYPAGATVHALFAEQAARTPHAVAVESGDLRLTYAELDARAERLAAHLQSLGVRAEARVGICLERGPELVSAILAVLKAGGAYVPLDPGYPAERLAYLLADSGVTALVTQASLLAALPARDGLRAVTVDEDREAIDAAVPSALPRPETGADALAYVMYTSGSTGTPKGVAVPHRAVVRLVRGAGFAAMGADEVVLQAAPVSFDAATLELWAPLLNGGRVVLMPGATPTLEALGGVLVRHGVTTLWLTAGLFQAMVQERLDDLAGVRQLLAGGDVLPPEPVRRVRERFPDLRLINGYGPTENTTFTCCHTVPAEWDGGPVPIGTPIGGTYVRVLDAALRPVPPGVPGELYAGGAGLARGYLNRAGLTAERFVPDPFPAAPGARLYRTGDRARWRADGTLEFMGRLDQQVKLRGFRIEPSEVESALLRHADVRECAVVVREDAPGEKRLAAYVVGGADAEALRSHLRGLLPEYMLPAAFVPLDALPLSPNGKVDRAALPAPEAGSAGAYVAPRTPAEEALAAIWAEVLKQDRVGVGAGFFELGGHSLAATRVVSRVRQAFGVELPLRALFEASTLAELAARVEALRRPEPAPSAPAPGAGPFPLSFAQERLWFLERLQPGSAVYNIPWALRLHGPLHAPALERALGELVRRHHSLRTTFHEGESGPVQQVAPFAGFTLATDNLAALPTDAREAEVARRVDEDAARPFDLAAGPPFRAALLRLGADEHVLLLCMHHAVSDGWSMGVLFGELGALYAAHRDGGDAGLADLPLQYAEYAARQRESLRGEALDREVAYWRARLAGAPALLALPADRPRPAVQSWRGATERIDLPPELLQRLQALGRTERATPFMVLLAAFQLLLSKYAATEDVVVGTPVAGRTTLEVEGLIGFFVNTLALRTDLSGDPAFREVVRRARDTVLGAFEHQALPFEKLVEAVQPGRSLGHAPVFQVSFALHHAEGGPGSLPGLRGEIVNAAHPVTKFDLSVAFAVGDGFRMVLEYATDLFDRATILRMAGHLRRVLEQVAEAPDARASQVELPTPDERRAVLDEWNRDEIAVPAGACLHHGFETWAARAPERRAVIAGDETATYGALNARANRLAHHLRALGVGAETRVGICLERGMEMVVALLAAFKAGGACVPLDPAYPAERLAYMLDDAEVKVLVTQESLRGLLPATAAAVVSVDGDAARIAAAPSGDPGADVAPRNLAYLVYTSGSTGAPKGVAVEHASAVALATWAAGVWSEDELSGVLASTSISFDVSVAELFVPLALGGCAIVAENALELPRLAAAGQVRMVNTVPSAMAALLEGGGIPAGVTTANLAGEPLRAELADALYGAGIARVIDLYGPSEDTTYSTWAVRAPGGPATIGRPIASTRAYVLDAALRPLPPGVPGELCLGGRGLARGYLGRPALTAERFAPDPFDAEPGRRLYRTGDRARWRADGTLEYLGRLDHQVKVRGFRVEPGEIEAALRRCPGVRDCAVMARPHAGGDVRLVAWVAGDAEPDALRTALRRTLPEHMVPAAFVGVDALPLTPNGKLDRRALPDPEPVAPGRRLEPETELETRLAALWRDLLGAEAVGVEDNFFDLGGHSLLLARMQARLARELGHDRPLVELFQYPTIRSLAASLQGGGDDAAAARSGSARAGVRQAVLDRLPLRRPREVVIAADPVGAVVRFDAVDAATVEAPVAAAPLSFAQERLWFLERLQPGSAFYNVPFALRLSGPLDAAALERALGEIVRRHQALRTTFHEVDGAPVQAVAPFAGFALAVEGVSAAEDPSAEVRRRLDEEAARPFDLATGPLFRALLLRVSDSEHVLLLCMHHIASDGWSLGVLFRELAELYERARAGVDTNLPGLPLQYAEYAAGQRERLRGNALDAEISYWRRRLSGAPALLDLPTDRPRPALQRYRGATERIELPAALMDGVRALGRSERATPFMVLLAAFQVLLSKYAGTDDVVVGTPVSGRTRGELEPMIGFFVNTLVLRTDLSGDPAFREAVRRVREGVLGAFDHQELPFEKLVEALQPERSLGHAPLFQVSFAVSEDESGAGTLAGLRAERVMTDLPVTKFDLSVCFVLGDGFGVVLEYATDLFDRATVLRMTEHLRRVLEQAVAAPDAPLSALVLLDAAERARVLQAWSGAQVEPSNHVPVHRLFQAQAERTPWSTALVSGGVSTPFRELDERANRLANHLARRGVGPDVRVGVCLERGAEMVVALLAVLKAGGAYVPLEPSYPEDRFAFVLADAGVRTTVTESRFAARLPADAETVCVDAARAEIAREAASAPRAEAAPDDLAYVLYTSGSTGHPKGVAVPHRALAAHTGWMRRAHPLAPADRVLQKTAFTFDASVWEFWAPLAEGATLVVAGPEAHRDPAALASEVARSRITILQLVPSFLHALLDAGALDGCRTLRRLFCGGEALPAGLAARAHGALGAEVVNLYGPTEACIDAVTHVHAGEAGATVPIGRPVDGVRAYLLDGAGHPLPAGVPGELHLGGEQLARGYLGRPALTAERFVPDPFSGIPGARLFRTGDRARWMAEPGEGGPRRPCAGPYPAAGPLHGRIPVLEFLGRRDAQVKVRGYRVEPGEIEAALETHPAVRRAAVAARQAAPGDVRLVAWVAADDAVSDADLRDHLRGRLPAHMLPATFVRMDALPLTPAGKLDRRALPAPAPSQGAGRRLEPGTGLEASLAALWRELLDVDAVGAEDSFFDLGGHSLLLARMQGRLAPLVGRQVPLVELFQYPTVRSLAAWLQGQAEGASAEAGQARGGIRAAVRSRLATRRPEGVAG